MTSARTWIIGATGLLVGAAVVVIGGLLLGVELPDGVVAPDDEPEHADVRTPDEGESPLQTEPPPTADDDGGQPFVYKSEVAGEVSIPPGFPTPETTGLAGLGVDPEDLPVYQGPTTITDERTIEGMRIQSGLRIDGGDLTVKGSYIESPADYVLIETSSSGVLTLEDTTVRVANGEAHGLRGSNITIRRSDIRQGTTVLQLGNHSTLEDSFIADAGMPPYPDGHHDGVQVQNAKDGVEVINNTILSDHQGQNSAIFIQSHDNWSGVADVRIEGNFISGGNYTMYLDAQDENGPLTGTVVRYNVWNEDSWRHGPISRNNVGEDLVWVDNRTTKGDPLE